MHISFADTRPSGDYTLVIPAAGAHRPALGERSPGLDGALRRQRFEGETGGIAEHYGDGDGGRRMILVGIGNAAKPAEAAEKLGGAIVARLLTSG